MGHPLRTMTDCPVCRSAREGAWCANLDDPAFFFPHLDVWLIRIFDGPVYPAPHSICTQGPRLRAIDEDEDERLNLHLEYDSLFAMTVGRTLRTLRPKPNRRRGSGWKGEAVPDDVYKVKLSIMAVNGRCIRPSCQAPFPAGHHSCRRGHRLGTFVAFLCSECEEAFGKASRRCPCGYHEEDVPERPALFPARAWRGMPVPRGVFRELEVVHRRKGKCSWCGRRMGRRATKCYHGHQLGDPIGFSCTRCGSFFHPDTSMCICGYHEEDVPIDTQDD